MINDNDIEKGLAFARTVGKIEALILALKSELIPLENPSKALRIEIVKIELRLLLRIYNLEMEDLK